MHVSTLNVANVHINYKLQYIQTTSINDARSSSQIDLNKEIK